MNGDTVEEGSWGEPRPNYCPFCGEPYPERRGAGYYCETHDRMWWLD